MQTIFMHGIAGTYPECTEDYIKIYDGRSSQSTTHGPYCGFTKPGTIKLSSNMARVQFYSGPSHTCSFVRVKCSFQTVDTHTTPILVTSHPYPTSTSTQHPTASTLASTSLPLTTSHPSPTTLPRLQLLFPQACLSPHHLLNVVG